MLALNTQLTSLGLHILRLLLAITKGILKTMKPTQLKATT